MTTKKNADQYPAYDEHQEIAPTDEKGRYARIVHDVEASGMPTFVVLLGTSYAGTVIDEANADGSYLPRGRYSAISSKKGELGFFSSIQDAADAIAETWPAPQGPKSGQEPSSRVVRANLRIMGAMERYNTIAEAASLYAAGGIRPASAWKRAVENEWMRRHA